MNSELNPFEAPAEKAPIDTVTPSGVPIELANPVTQPAKARLWTVLVTMLVATGAYVVASVVSVVLMTMLYIFSNDSTQMPDIEVLMSEFATYPGALWVLVAPGQFTILAVTLVATFLSPEKFTKRLTLQTPKWPIWVTIAASFAAPLVSLIWSIPLSMVVQSSQHLEFMVTLFKNAGQGIGIVSLFLCVSILPAISEEWLFRGYIQSRLLKRWHPALAIGVSSLLFAGFHMDPVHVVAVIPLGLWLGVITYYSGSIYPAMLAHAYNNAISIIATVYLGSETLNSSFASIENIVILGIGLPGLIVTMFWLATRGRAETQTTIAA